MRGALNNEGMKNLRISKNDCSESSFDKYYNHERLPFKDIPFTGDIRADAGP